VRYAGCRQPEVVGAEHYLIILPKSSSPPVFRKRFAKCKFCGACGLAEYSVVLILTACPWPLSERWLRRHGYGPGLARVHWSGPFARRPGAYYDTPRRVSRSRPMHSA
jgi:hypothetical protein